MVKMARDQLTFKTFFKTGLSQLMLKRI